MCVEAWEGGELRLGSEASPRCLSGTTEARDSSWMSLNVE